MPRIPFKKKKKKNLPKPPSLSGEGGSMFDEVLGELRATRPSQPRDSTIENNDTEYLPPPPSQPLPPSFDSSYNIPGPPRKDEPSYFDKTQELQGPPIESPSRRSPNLPKSAFDPPSRSYGAEEISDDILEELKMKDFRPELVKAPPKKFIPKSQDDIKRQRL